MPNAYGRAFTTANFLSNLATLKAINFGASDPAGVWFVVPNAFTNNIEVWVWQPDSIVATDEVSVIRPDSILPGSPGRCIQRLKFDASQLGGILAAIAALTTTGLIELSVGGTVSTSPVTDFIKTLLNDVDAAAARSTLGLSEAATRAIGTDSGQIRDAADEAYSNARSPLSHANTHLSGGGDSLGLGAAAFRSIGNSGGQIRDAADGAYSNARTPTSHASTHAVGGTDVVPVFGYLAVLANTTLTTANQRQLIDVNAAVAAIAITLPAAATVGSGWAVQIRKSDSSANIVTISRSGSDTINGATTLPLAVQHQSFILFSLGGTSWGVIAGFPGSLPANSLLGRGGTAGAPEVIASNTFALSSALTTKADLVGGFVPSSQLPSYVDDILEYATLANFPTTGEIGKIYVTIDTNLTYRWSGSVYVEISASLALGTTSGTAYRGDLGNTAYQHSQLTIGNPHNVTAFQVGLGALTNNLQLTVANNLSDLNSRQTALNNLAGGITANRFLKGNGTNVVFGQVDLATADITGILPIANGTNFVAISGDQSGIGGNKTFTGAINITNATQSTSTTTGAHIVSGGQGVGGNQYIGGFTQLGDNIAIKQKQISGTTGTGGADVAVTHGITGTIRGVTCIVTDVANRLMSPGMTLSGAQNEYYVYTTSTQFIVYVPPTNSANVVSRPFVALITYSA
ncbi:hypothetical protein [Microcoleus sp. B3-D7]|uniref:hypothetical protein n=1 Tax=Microcoleus sp. B3-D7 TaxID=2818659 RepID=UPI002FD35529